MDQIIGDVSLPTAYPSSAHAELHTRAHDFFQAAGVPPDIQQELRTALNSVAYRFKMCTDAGCAFCDSLLRYGAAPAQPERYAQERDFFDFVVTGFTAIECAGYGLFALGAALWPAQFPFTTEALRRKVTLRVALDTCGRVPAANAIHTALSVTLAAPELEEWLRWRNGLSHRGLPGRIISAGIATTNLAQSTYGSFGGVPGPALDPSLIEGRTEWLASRLQQMLQSGVQVLPPIRGVRSFPDA